MSVMRACVARLNYVALEFSYYMMLVVRKEAARELRSSAGLKGWLEFAGLENDGVEQEQTYIVHTMKNFNVYDM